MVMQTPPGERPLATRRLPKSERRLQLLTAALRIVREEGADRLTLGYLASCAGVSKPVAYDHFLTRSGLLIELYRWIDIERVNAFQEAMAGGEHSSADAMVVLASTYIDCAADTTHAFHRVGAALAGSDEKAAVFEELLSHCVQMFVAVLQPHTKLAADDLERRCIGLVGAGEALSAAFLKGRCTKDEAVDTFVRMIDGALAL